MNDAALLADIPEHIAIGGLLKATAAQDGVRRILYLEASNEGADHQDEVVLQKALSDSSDYFMRHGNIDLEHYSLLGPSRGIPDYMTYEIGKPIEVSMSGKTTFVKSELYQGESPMAKNANMVWDSLTKQSPPCRWYPSVGGSVMAKSIRTDPETQKKHAVIEKVRWNNIGLTRTPVNKTVPEASTMPLGVFAKSLNAFVMAKTLTAGYGTDSAELAGGSSLREQSLSGVPANYWEFRERIAKSIRDGNVGSRPGARELVNYSVKNFSMSASDASEHVEHFLHDLRAGLKRSKSK
jgi:hypothetical protein